jgi:DNA repair exonuclease SbcCD nuclease subunit
MRVIHASDLHLRDTAGERDYGISVLQDIIEIVRSTESQVLLITGDLFDSFDDAESLRRTLAERLATLPEPTRVLYIPGNHEYLRAKDRAFDRFEFGRAELHCAPPFSRVTIGAVEFLLIPHQANYGGYLEWSIPERRGAVRILAAHATVAGLFFNDSDEEGGGYLDRDLLERFDPDYVALGHIHAGQSFPAGRGDAVYPGSARVWRKGEFGPRSVVAVETDGELSWRRIPIPSAGQYRNINVSLDPDGRIGEDLDDLEVGPADLLDLNLVGVVESDTVLSRTVQTLTKRFAPRVRELSVSTEGVILVDGVSREPIVERFLAVWRRHGAEIPSGEEGAQRRREWYKARELGLRVVKDVIEQKR